MKAFALAIGLLCSSAVDAEIREIHQLKEVEQILSTPLSSSDWVLFDIDYTLTAPDHPALQMSVIKQNKQRFRQELAQFTEQERDLLPMLMVTQTPNKLTEAAVPELLDVLRRRGATVLGFTSADTSVFPDVGEVPTWRSRELKRLGITFEASQIPYEHFELKYFPPFRGTYPLYSDGILYANNLPGKGEVLAAFIDTLQDRPTRVVLVDDTLDKLQSVQEAMDQKKIPFLGLHYQPIDAAVPQVSDEAWRAVWDAIHRRVEAANIPEGIIQTAHPAAIDWAVSSAPCGSLIIFDVGNVLLVHCDAVLRHKYRPWVKGWFDREAPEVDVEGWRILSGIIDREAKMGLVNSIIPKVIEKGKTKGIVIALSKFWVGSTGDDEMTFEKQRLTSLKSVGIDFGHPFSSADGWLRKDLQASYSHGLIQTEAPLKGPVLQAFLQYIGWQPKAIIFVDDRKDQCESIAAAAKDLKIPALCINYTEAIDHTPPLDPVVAGLQLRTLVTERRWLSDEEAHKGGFELVQAICRKK